jgi:hypothetical protein
LEFDLQAILEEVPDQAAADWIPASRTAGRQFDLISTCIRKVHRILLGSLLFVLC